MRRISYLLVLLLSTGVLLAAGCGGDDDDGGGGTGAATPEATKTATEEASGGGGGALTLTADPGGAISWDKSELSAPAGNVTIKLVNDSDVPHAVEIEGNGVEEESETVTGATTEVSADLKPGEYEYYCPVGSHRQTMNGTLTVK
jgi:plastocyanin